MRPVKEVGLSGRSLGHWECAVTQVKVVLVRELLCRPEPDPSFMGRLVTLPCAPAINIH